MNFGPAAICSSTPHPHHLLSGQDWENADAHFPPFPKKIIQKIASSPVWACPQHPQNENQYLIQVCDPKISWRCVANLIVIWLNMLTSGEFGSSQEFCPFPNSVLSRICSERGLINKSSGGIIHRQDIVWMVKARCKNYIPKFDKKIERCWRGLWKWKAPLGATSNTTLRILSVTPLLPKKIHKRPGRGYPPNP